MAKGWKGHRRQHGLASKGVRTTNGGTRQFQKEFKNVPTHTLIKMAENLEDIMYGERFKHPKALKTTEEKERYEYNVNKLNAMTFELDKRGIDF